MADLANRTILVVDDEIASMRYYILQLEHCGATVKKCGSSDAAMQLLHGVDQGICSLGVFDAILLDMGMPLPKQEHAGFVDDNSTGGFILGKIREHDNGHLPVILFSQLSSADVVMPAWEAYNAFACSRGQSVPSELPIQEMQGIMVAEFNTYCWLKLSHSPITLADSLAEILGE